MALASSYLRPAESGIPLTRRQAKCDLFALKKGYIVVFESRQNARYE